jgi:hypothetical protein
MSIETMKLRPGDKVRITNTAFDCSVDVVDIVIATQDSIATVLSYSEYCDYVLELHGAEAYTEWKIQHREKHLSFVKEYMDMGRMYPIRIEKFVPYEGDDDPRISVACRVGYITMMGVEFLEKVI